MNNAILYSASVAASYLLGAIPFGFIIARMRGIDIRKVGSGNIGATNVFRTVGKSWGLLTFLCDVLKGFTPSFVFPLIVAKFGEVDTNLLSILCACGAVAGHNWPIFLGFKGGKGIATTAGALLGIAPAALGIGFATWIIVFPVSRYVSMASILAAIAVPVSGWILYKDNGMAVPVFLTIIGILAVVRHRSNIQRLIMGTENRFEFKKKK